MEICVISDTHAVSLVDLPEKLVGKLGKVDLIIHAGDFTHKRLLDELRSLNTVKAVYGNMDPADIRQSLPEQDEFSVENTRIGLTHGAGSRQGIRERVRRMFSSPDIIIYGHSHQVEKRMYDGVLMLNPGTARNSFATIIIEKKLKIEIIQL